MLPQLQPALKFKKSRLPRWLQYALMVLAGAGSFYGALQLGPKSAPEDGGVELHKPSATPTGVTTAPTAGAPIAHPRLDAGVLQNPFGALNLSVTVESLLQPVPVPVVVAEVKVMHPVKKVEAPPPPVVLQAPLPPPEPVAPPLPYRVLGSIQGSRIGNGAPVVFLSDRGNTLAVRAGDEIDNTYRVERISADKVEFTYLPLKTLQWLPITR
jgi:hypothetical protein